MKKILFNLTPVLTILAAIGCGNQQTEFPKNTPIRAEVLQMIPFEENDDVGQAVRFKLAPGEFQTLKDLDNLTGDYFTTLKGGKLSVKEVNGSIVKTSGFEGGSAPKIRYHLKDNLVIPDDYDSLMMISNYYQFDHIIQNLEYFSGVSPEELRAKNGEFKILFHPTISLDSKIISGNLVLKMNAAFDPENFQFLILPSTKMEDVPLGSNLQVIAHEFGHLVFQHLIGSETLEDPLMNHYSMKGINEGFADYFSYSITGSTNILSGSFGWNDMISSERNFSKVSFSFETTPSKIDNQSHPKSAHINDKVCSGAFYCYGTLFAKSLFEVQNSIDNGPNTKEKRASFLKQVIQSLSKTKARLNSNSLVQGLREKHALHTAESESVLGAFFESFISGFDDATTKKKVFDSISNQFGTKGFPHENRLRSL